MKIQRKNGRPMTNDEAVRIIERDEVYPNYVEAAKAIKGNRCCVYLCLKGYRKRHLGYTFEYAECDDG